MMTLLANDGCCECIELTEPLLLSAEDAGVAALFDCKLLLFIAAVGGVVVADALAVVDFNSKANASAN